MFDIRVLFAAIPACLPLSAHAQTQATPTVPDPVGCLIEPYETVSLTPATAGIVARILVERGDQVKRGDVLVEFDSRTEEIALELAAARAADRSRIEALEARRAFLEDLARRSSDLAGRGTGSVAAASEAQMEAEVAAHDLDQATAALQQAELERRAAEVTLDKLRITAPIDGVITERRLSVGEYHDTQAPVLMLARLDRLRVEAFAPISHLGHLTPGQEVTIHPEAPISGTWPARITIVDHVLDAATATLGFRMEMDNPGLTLPAGLRCEVSFAMTRADPDPASPRE